MGTSDVLATAVSPHEEHCAREAIRALDRARQLIAQLAPLTRARDERAALILPPIVQQLEACVQAVDEAFEVIGVAPRQAIARKEAVRQRWLELYGRDYNP